jgi:FKBP-type peptidyl-prolyl cis-trans isomerase
MRVFYIFIVCIFVSCNLPISESINIPKGIEYKYHQLGEGVQPQKGQTIGGYILITSVNGDTLHYVPRYPYFFELNDSSIDSLFMAMHPEDSMSFTLDRTLINEYFKFYQLQNQDSGKAILNIKLTGVYTKIEADSIQKVLLSKRELNEQTALVKYLNEVEIDFELFEGVYRKKTYSTNGTSIRYGDEVTINYTGRFFDGYVFDDTYLKPRPPSFIYGKEYQLIDGIHYGLNGMNEGEKVKIILPSRRAFGKDGSIAGIVPPYTTVIFDIHIIKVIKK